MWRSIAGAVGVCIPLSLLAAPATQPLQLYRYLDDRGAVVLNRQGVPPEFVSKGYQVLNAQGRVLQTVPPALSPEQAQANAAQRAQADADARLRTRYTSVEDLERTRQRQLTEIDGLVALTRGDLQNLQAQQASLQGEAANQERNGQPISPSVLDQLEAVRQRRAELNAQVERYQKMRQDAGHAFDADRARLEQLK